MKDEHKWDERRTSTEMGWKTNKNRNGMKDEHQQVRDEKRTSTLESNMNDKIGWYTALIDGTGWKANMNLERDEKQVITK